MLCVRALIFVVRSRQLSRAEVYLSASKLPSYFIGGLVQRTLRGWCDEILSFILCCHVALLAAASFISLKTLRAYHFLLLTPLLFSRVPPLKCF